MIMNGKKQKVAGAVIVVILATVTCGLGYCRWSIQTGLDRYCSVAQSEHPHPDEDVAAMMAYVRSDSHSLKDRNHMVWALGQARDGRAVSLLEAFYVGGECDHGQYLCQGELAKAIKLCNGATPNLLGIRTP